MEFGVQWRTKGLLDILWTNQLVDGQLAEKLYAYT